MYSIGYRKADGKLHRINAERKLVRERGDHTLSLRPHIQPHELYIPQENNKHLTEITNVPV